MKTRRYVEHKTGHSVSQVHETAGLVVFNLDRSQQVAVIGSGGDVTWTRPHIEDLSTPYEEEIVE